MVQSIFDTHIRALALVEDSRFSLSRNAKLILLVVHALGIAALWRYYHQPVWFVLPTLALFLVFPILTLRQRSSFAIETLAPLFFLYAIHRFHLPGKFATRDANAEAPRPGLIPFKGFEHLLQRRFEEAIDVFLKGCVRHSVIPGNFVTTVADGHTWLRRGMRFLIYSADFFIVIERSRQVLAELRGGRQSRGR